MLLRQQQSHDFKSHTENLINSEQMSRQVIFRDWFFSPPQGFTGHLITNGSTAYDTLTDSSFSPVWSRYWVVRSGGSQCPAQTSISLRFNLGELKMAPAKNRANK